MSYIGQEKLTKGMHPFPDEFVEESKKDASWFLALAKAILCRYYTGDGIMSFNGREEMRMLKLYGSSNQDPGEAMKKMFTNYGKRKSDGGEHARQAWDNIDPTILPIMVKFKQTILGKFADIEHSFVADATDVFSVNEKEDAKYQAVADLLLEGVVNKINTEIGTPTVNKGQWKPKNIGEVNMYEEMKGFRLQAEYAIEKAVDHTYDKEVNWKRIKEKLIDNLCDFNICAVEDFTDKRDQVARLTHVDPERLVIDYSTSKDFDDPKFYGVYESWSIDNLRRTGEFTESQLKHIARMYLNKNISSGGNPNFDYYDRLDLATNTYGYGDFQVDVFRGHFKSFQTEYKKRVYNSFGKHTRTEPSEFGVIDTGKENEEVYVTDKDTLYKFHYVVGSDFVFDHGLAMDITRNVDFTVRLPITVVKLDGHSLTKRCIPNLRAMQLAWIKFQNALAKMRNKSIAVEFSALSNMSIKDTKNSPGEIMNVILNEGTLVYKATTSRGTVNLPGGKPIYELEGGMGSQLNEFITIFDLNRSMIQDFAGITAEASGGQNVPERQSAALSEMMYQNTNDNLKPIILKYHQVKEQSANSVALRIQNIIKFSKKGRDYYQRILGKINAESVLVPGGNTLREIGLTLFVMPDRTIKDTIIQSAMESLQVARADGGGIDESDFMLIVQLVEMGKVKDARRYMSAKIRENKDKVTKRQEEAQQSMQDSNLAIKKEELEKEKLKQQAEDARLQKAHDNKMAEINKEYDRKIELERAKRGLDMAVDNEQSKNLQPAFNR